MLLQYHQKNEFLHRNHWSFRFRGNFDISWIAVNCGTPTPATTRVVHIDPGPIPTLIASTPSLIKSFAASGVAISNNYGQCVFFLFFYKHRTELE